MESGGGCLEGLLERQQLEGHDRERRRPPSEAHANRNPHAPPTARQDLINLKMAVFETLSHGHMQRSSSAGSSGSARLSHPPLCRLWALYRKSLRLFLIGELTKPELDAVVIYTLGDENGTCGMSGWVGGWSFLLDFGTKNKIAVSPSMCTIFFQHACVNVLHCTSSAPYQFLKST